MLGAAYIACSLVPICSASLRRGGDLAWIDPAAIRYFRITDSVPRNLLYRGGVLAAGVMLLLLDAFPERWRTWLRTQNPAELEAGFLATVAAWSFSLFLAGSFSAPLQDLTLLLGLLLAVRVLRGEPRVLSALSRGFPIALACAAALDAALRASVQPSHLLICALLIYLAVGERRLGFHRRFPKPYASAAALALLFAAFWTTIPTAAFRFPLDLSRLPPDLVTFYEMHLDLFALGPAQKLASHVPFSEIQAFYGLASPLLLVALHRAAGCVIDLGTFLKLAFAFKYAFVCLTAASLYFYGGRRFLPALVFSLWILSWNNSASPDLEANHSAVRFLGVPIFFLVLWSVRRRSFPVLLAAAAPALWLCALLNPETAFVLFASTLVYAWFRWRDDGLTARLERTLALTASAVPAALLCRSATASMFSSGFGGLDFAWSPAPFAVILLAVIVWADVAASDGSTPKNAYRAAAAAFLLLWGAYYVNRPSPADLDVHLYVFGFFALDIIRAAGLKTASVPRRVGFLMLIAVAAPLLTGTLNASARDLLWQFRRPQPIYHPSDPEQVASGVRVSSEFAARLNAARATWEKYSRPGEPCMMLTSHPIFVSAATCYSSLPFADPFQAFTLENDRRELDAIHSSRAKYLFIEPASDLTDDAWRDAFARLTAAIAPDYHLREKTPHLDVWERR